jgi:hypothetical protein
MRRKRGECICSNDVVIRTDTVDAAVLKTVGEVLDSRVIEKSIELAIARLQDGRDHVVCHRERLRAELDDVDARLARLVQALVNGGPMEAVVAQIKVEEERKRRLTAEYDALDGGLCSRGVRLRHYRPGATGAYRGRAGGPEPPDDSGQADAAQAAGRKDRGGARYGRWAAGVPAHWASERGTPAPR